jgi:hypothetical protein
MENFHSVANRIEAGIWIAVAAVLLAKSLRATGRLRLILGTLCAAFIVFGISDVIESHTGAWWRPLWLLGMKGICLVVIFGGIWTYFKAEKSRGK